MKELRVRAYIKPLKRYATGIDTIQFHKCCDVAGPGIWTVVTAHEGIFDFDDIVIEQDTGLKDKNGKRIREGDIVKNIEGVNETAVCVWDESNAEFDFRCEDGKCTRDNVKSWLEMYIVIGNVHENPELLGGEE